MADRYETEDEIRDLIPESALRYAEEKRRRGAVPTSYGDPFVHKDRHSWALDNPLRHGLAWWQSAPGAIYSAGRMLGNQITPGMYPDANKDFQYNVNTLTGGATDSLGNNKNSYWSDHLDAIHKRRNDVAGFNDAQVQEEFRQATERQMPTGEQYVKETGLIDGVPATALGSLLDAGTDPFSVAVTGPLAALKYGYKAAKPILRSHAIADLLYGTAFDLGLRGAAAGAQAMAEDPDQE